MWYPGIQIKEERPAPYEVNERYRLQQDISAVERVRQFYEAEFRWLNQPNGLVESVVARI